MALLPSLAMAQSLVSTSPQNRTVLLEDYTGVNCQYCPDGHVIMDALKEAEPERMVLLGIHAGGFAVPSPTQFDFRTTWGTTMNNFFAVNSYPAGVLDRHTFPAPAGLAQGRGYWETSAQALYSMSSPVNLGVSTTYDAGTRELVVKVELLYTDNSPGGNDYINVLIKEGGFIGSQISTAGNIPNYQHDNVFRVNITDTWGDEVTGTNAGSSVIREYTYTLPETYVAENCDVIAFVGEYQSDIYQAREVPLTGGTTLVIGDLTDVAQPYAGGTEAMPSTFTSGLTNLLGEDAEYHIVLTALNEPWGWQGSFTIAGGAPTNDATVAVPEGTDPVIQVSVVPGGGVGIGHYELRVTSTAEPDAPALVQEFKVIAGVHDLVVTSPLPEAVSAEARYITGLEDAGNVRHAAVDRNDFIRFAQADALGEVINIYRNISWTFPSLVDAEVAVLGNMMDNGVNLFIAGQDIGWDQSGADGAYGTAATQAFYTNYMLAEYVADGSTTNTPVNFVDADEVFGELANSTLANVFAGNTYPEEITPIAPATAIFNYGTTTKIGGLRAQTTNYKLVYFGVGPEQFSNATIGTDIVRLSHDWFYGVTSDISEMNHDLTLGSPYPVPTSGLVTLPLNDLTVNATLSIHDATGRKVMERAIAANTNQLQLDLSGLSNGLYVCRLNSELGTSVRNIQVAR